MPIVKSIVDHLVGDGQSTTLRQLFAENEPEQWVRDHFSNAELDMPLQVKSVDPGALQIGRGQTIAGSVEEAKSSDRWRIVQQYMAEAGAPVVIEGNRLLDGQHRAMAAFISGRKLLAVNVNDLGIRESEDWDIKDVAHPITTLTRPERFGKLPVGAEFKGHDGIVLLKVNDQNVLVKGIEEIKDWDRPNYVCYPLGWDMATIKSFRRQLYKPVNYAPSIWKRIMWETDAPEWKDIMPPSPPTKDDITYTLECEPEDIEPDYDDPVLNDQVLRNLANGNQWAWCSAHLTASYTAHDGTEFTYDDYLGGCSYESAEDFMQPGGYYDDMKDDAYRNILYQFQKHYGLAESEDFSHKELIPDIDSSGHPLVYSDAEMDELLAMGWTRPLTYDNKSVPAAYYSVDFTRTYGDTQLHNDRLLNVKLTRGGDIFVYLFGGNGSFRNLEELQVRTHNMGAINNFAIELAALVQHSQHHRFKAVVAALRQKIKALTPIWESADDDDLDIKSIAGMNFEVTRPILVNKIPDGTMCRDITGRTIRKESDNCFTILRPYYAKNLGIDSLGDVIVFPLSWDLPSIKSWRRHRWNMYLKGKLSQDKLGLAENEDSDLGKELHSASVTDMLLSGGWVELITAGPDTLYRKRNGHEQKLIWNERLGAFELSDNNILVDMPYPGKGIEGQLIISLRVADELLQNVIEAQEDTPEWKEVMPPENVAEVKPEFDGDTMTYALYIDGKLDHFCWSTNEAVEYVQKHGYTWKNGEVPQLSMIPKDGSPLWPLFVKQFPQHPHSERWVAEHPGAVQESEDLTWKDVVDPPAVERWVFTKDELAQPETCTSNDEFLALFSDIPPVVVYRDGRVTNRWEDGTAGVPNDAYDKAANSETLYRYSDNEIADTWKDVLVDPEGKFLGWAPVAEFWDASKFVNKLVENDESDWKELIHEPIESFLEKLGFTYNGYRFVRRLGPEDSNINLTVLKRPDYDDFLVGVWVLLNNRWIRPMSEQALKSWLPTAIESNTIPEPPKRFSEAEESGSIWKDLVHEPIEKTLERNGFSYDEDRYVRPVGTDYQVSYLVSVEQDDPHNNIYTVCLWVGLHIFWYRRVDEKTLRKWLADNLNSKTIPKPPVKIIESNGDDLDIKSMWGNTNTLHVWSNGTRLTLVFDPSYNYGDPAVVAYNAQGKQLFAYYVGNLVIGKNEVASTRFIGGYKIEPDTTQKISEWVVKNLKMMGRTGQKPYDHADEATFDISELLFHNGWENRGRTIAKRTADGKLYQAYAALGKWCIGQGSTVDRCTDDQKTFLSWLRELSLISESVTEGIIAYHASPNKFRKFDTSKEGAHFGTAEQAANVRKHGLHAPRPYHLDIKNPLRMRDIGVWNNFNNLHSALAVEGHITPEQADEAWASWQRSDAEGWEALKQALEKNGYDGIVYKNEQEGPGDSYIALRSGQIKPAPRMESGDDFNIKDVGFVSSIPEVLRGFGFKEMVSGDYVKTRITPEQEVEMAVRPVDEWWEFDVQARLKTSANSRLIYSAAIHSPASLVNWINYFSFGDKVNESDEAESWKDLINPKLADTLVKAGYEHVSPNTWQKSVDDIIRAEVTQTQPGRWHYGIYAISSGMELTIKDHEGSEDEMLAFLKEFGALPRSMPESVAQRTLLLPIAEDEFIRLTTFENGTSTAAHILNETTLAVRSGPAKSIQAYVEQAQQHPQNILAEVAEDAGTSPEDDPVYWKELMSEPLAKTGDNSINRPDRFGNLPPGTDFVDSSGVPFYKQEGNFVHNPDYGPMDMNPNEIVFPRDWSRYKIRKFLRSNIELPPLNEAQDNRKRGNKPMPVQPEWKELMPPKPNFYVHGSHGWLTCSDDGEVLHPPHSKEPVPPEYNSIVRVDTEEWARAYPGEEPSDLGAVDILDVGYWNQAGGYIEPDRDWREQFASGSHAAARQKKAEWDEERQRWGEQQESEEWKDIMPAPRSPGGFWVAGDGGEFACDQDGNYLEPTPPPENAIVGQPVITNPEADYKNIIRVNVDEWEKTYPGEDIQDVSVVDIRDLGYWKKSGEYVPPDRAWRNKLRELLREIGKERTSIRGTINLESHAANKSNTLVENSEEATWKEVMPPPDPFIKFMCPFTVRRPDGSVDYAKHYFSDEVGDWVEDFNQATIFGLSSVLHDGVIDLVDCPMGTEAIIFVTEQGKFVAEVPLDDNSGWKIVDSYRPEIEESEEWKDVMGPEWMALAQAGGWSIVEKAANGMPLSLDRERNGSVQFINWSQPDRHYRFIVRGIGGSIIEGSLQELLKFAETYEPNH